MTLFENAEALKHDHIVSYFRVTLQLHYKILGQYLTNFQDKLTLTPFALCKVANAAQVTSVMSDMQTDIMQHSGRLF